MFENLVIVNLLRIKNFTMRYLAIDYGSKRVGLALSDEGLILGFPYKTVENKDLIKVLKEIIKKEEVGKVILGLPLNFQMDETEQTKKVKNFKSLFEKNTDIRIEYENELLTTAQAKKSGVADKHIDASSAALILQSYLDRIDRQ